MGSPDPLTGQSEHHIVLFDGVCNLCNAAVQFIVKRDKAGKFRFAPLQSNIALRYKQHFGKPSRLYSILLIKNGRIYDRSRALLEIARELSSPWPILYVLIVVPPFLRDIFYWLAARSRYRLFGKKDECMLPTQELKARFLV